MKKLTAVICLTFALGILLGKQSFGAEPNATQPQHVTVMQDDWIMPVKIPEVQEIEIPEPVQVDKSAKAQINCLAENIYYEARGESLAGQFAVAMVTANRVKSGKYPPTVCGVVHQRAQFSWTRLKNRFIHDKTAWKQAVALAEMVYENYIIGDELPKLLDATHFHTTAIKPKWSRSAKLTRLATIDNHRFYALRAQ